MAGLVEQALRRTLSNPNTRPWQNKYRYEEGPPQSTPKATIKVLDHDLNTFLDEFVSELRLPEVSLTETTYEVNAKSSLARAVLHVLIVDGQCAAPFWAWPGDTTDIDVRRSVAAYKDPEFEVIKTRTLVVVGVALVGASLGVLTGGVQGLVPRLISAEAGLLIDVLSSYVSNHGRQPRRGNWTEEYIRRILEEGSYTYVELAGRARLHRQVVLECLLALERDHVVQRMDDQKRHESIWTLSRSS